MFSKISDIFSHSMFPTGALVCPPHPTPLPEALDGPPAVCPYGLTCAAGTRGRPNPPSPHNTTHLFGCNLTPAPAWLRSTAPTRASRPSAPGASSPPRRPPPPPPTAPPPAIWDGRGYFLSLGCSGYLPRLFPFPPLKAHHAGE